MRKEKQTYTKISLKNQKNIKFKYQSLALNYMLETIASANFEQDNSVVPSIWRARS